MEICLCQGRKSNKAWQGGLPSSGWFVLARGMSLERAPELRLDGGWFCNCCAALRGGREQE